jgi:hypothetical protein
MGHINPLDHPALRELYYIRGILRNRVHYMNDAVAISELKRARDAGVTVETLRELTLDCWCWTDWKLCIRLAIADVQGIEIVL